jgi:hypothetical protein
MTDALGGWLTERALTLRGNKLSSEVGLRNVEKLWCAVRGLAYSRNVSNVGLETGRS